MKDATRCANINRVEPTFERCSTASRTSPRSPFAYNHPALLKAATTDEMQVKSEPGFQHSPIIMVQRFNDYNETYSSLCPAATHQIMLVLISPSCFRYSCRKEEMDDQMSMFIRPVTGYLRGSVGHSRHGPRLSIRRPVMSIRIVIWILPSDTLFGDDLY